MNQLALLISIIGLLALPEPTLGSCASQGSSGNTNFESVALVVDPSANSILASIEQGRGQWNDSPCVTSLNPVPYPRFVTSSFPGRPNVIIELKQGFRDTEGKSPCGEFIRTTEGSGEINVYTMGRLPDGRTFSCDMDTPGVGGDTIAHELGHYLNLAESTCSSAIMGPTSLRSFNGQLIRTNARRILSSECNLADNISFTPHEEEEQACVRDPEPCTGTSPILLDLDNNGFNLARDPVFFDIDANGPLDLISWTRADQQDAFLCYDRNGNGKIDDGSELFGDSTPMASGYTATNGYIALAEFDEGYGGNFDRQITADDARFGELCLWLDQNHNGYSEPEEIMGLDDFGIVAIGLEYSESNGKDRFGNRFPFIGVAWELDEDGEIKKVLTTDAFFVLYN